MFTAPSLELLVLLLFASVGLTFILTHGYVFLPLRRRFDNHPTLSEFVHCPQCVGFWVGFLLTLFIEWWNIFPRFEFETLFVSGLMGLANSGACFILLLLLEKEPS